MLRRPTPIHYPILPEMPRCCCCDEKCPLPYTPSVIGTRAAACRVHFIIASLRWSTVVLGRLLICWAFFLTRIKLNVDTGWISFPIHASICHLEVLIWSPQTEFKCFHIKPDSDAFFSDLCPPLRGAIKVTLNRPTRSGRAPKFVVGAANGIQVRLRRIRSILHAFAVKAKRSFLRCTPLYSMVQIQGKKSS